MTSTTDVPVSDVLMTPRERVDDFVATHFRVRGTLRLHRVALGWDLLRAPLNIALAPVFLAVRIAAVLARLVRMRRFGQSLGRRRILLRTAVARQVGAAIAEDLLEGSALSEGAGRLVEEYTGTRAAVAEITTSLIVLGVGATLFSVATPGVVSLAPEVSEFVAHSSAVSSFPLGSRVGGLWYALFPIELPVSFVVVTGIVLAMLASLVTTFAGILADPVQVRLGLHRRRLLRLLEVIDRAERAPPTLPPEHVLARPWRQSVSAFLGLSLDRTLQARRTRLGSRLPAPTRSGRAGNLHPLPHCGCPPLPRRRVL